MDHFYYEFHARDLINTEALKQYADHTVKEIKSNLAEEVDIQINIEPEVKNKSLFQVMMSVVGLDEPIVVRKEGKHVLAVMKKVRKAVLRKIHRLTDRRISFRKRYVLKDQFAT